MPPTPAGLNAVAAARWAEVVPGLSEMGILGQVDGGALEAYCRTFGVWRELMTKVENGDQASFVPMIRLHKEVIQPLEAALGLHYSARCRMKAPTKSSERDAVADELFAPLAAV